MNYRCKICCQIIDNDIMCPYCGSDKKYIEPFFDEVNESIDECKMNNLNEKEDENILKNSESYFNEEEVNNIDFNTCNLDNKIEETSKEELIEEPNSHELTTKDLVEPSTINKSNENNAPNDKNLLNLEYLAKILCYLYTNKIEKVVDFQYIISNFIVNNFEADSSLEELISKITDEKIKKVLKQFTQK